MARNIARLTLALLVSLVGLGASLVGGGAQGVLGIALGLLSLVLGLPKQLPSLLLGSLQVSLALLLGLACLVLGMASGVLQTIGYLSNRLICLTLSDVKDVERLSTLDMLSTTLRACLSPRSGEEMHLGVQ